MSTGHVITFVLFLILVGITLAITAWARMTTSGKDDFYAAGRIFSGPQNGTALAGDYLSAASFLGVTGIISLSGYDGFLYSIGFIVGWLLTLLTVGHLRNAGRFTMADMLTRRVINEAPARTAAALSTVTVSIFYLIAQMVGAGALVSLLLGVTPGHAFFGMAAGEAKVMIIAVVGVLMICYVMFGGMKGTTWVQIIKALLLMFGVTVMTCLVLARFDFNVSSLLGAAARSSGKGAAFLEPGLKYGTVVHGNPHQTLINKIDLLSLALALVLGTSGLPHVVTRFFTVPDGKAARSSVNWAIGLTGIFYLMMLLLGFGAAALVGSKAIVEQDPTGNTAIPQLARTLGAEVGGRVGGDIMLAFVASVAFMTIIAVVSGLLMASATSLAHDYFGHVLMLGRPKESQEVGAAKLASLVIGVIAIILAIFAKNLNVAFLVGLAFALAAAANLPAIVLSLFWRKFTSTGLVAGIYGGLISTIVLVIFSPVVSGDVNPVTGADLSLFPKGVDFAIFPLQNPGIVSVPFGFLCAIAGTLLSRRAADPDRFTELSVRSLTGTDAH
jgi:cation/acetate symporter